MSGVWHFPSNARGKRQGFNDAGMDIFHEDPVGSLVRESIQNSLDAKRAGDTPVRVVFSLSELERETRSIADGLSVAFTLGLKKANKNDDRKARQFYERALKSLQGKHGYQVLGIHDFGTTGLTGTIDDQGDERSAWLALVKGSGDTFKQSAGAGGSYGHGSSAPLVMSGFRSVLYFTKIKAGEEIEERFQGTSRLESLRAEDLIGEEGWTQDQGHYGNGPSCGPLVGEKVPTWFRSERARITPKGVDSELGTSIFVMAPQHVTSESKFWDRIRISVLANYYYTIALGKLEVSLGDGVVLNAETIADLLAEVHIEDEDESEIATAATIDQLETSRTIAGEKKVHNLSIDGFGSVDLLLRIDESIPRSKVGVARSNGMLITREPWLLESKKLIGLRKFDLFVYVKDQGGSELLRQLEPPGHDAFQINRIDDEDERKKVRKLYMAFKAEVWNFIKEEAKHAVVDEIVPEELGKYFLANWSGELAGDNDPTNYSMVYGSFKRLKPKQGVAVWGDPDDMIGVAPRMGREDKGGKKKDSKHNFDDPLGEDEKKGKKSRRQVSDFRVDRDSKNPDVATVYFNAVDKVHRNLVILRSGADQLVEPIRFKPEKAEEWTTRLDLSTVSAGERKKLRLKFEPGTLVYSLEARLES